MAESMSIPTYRVSQTTAGDADVVHETYGTIPVQSTDCCPHCGGRLTLQEIISMMNRSGWIRYVPVRLPNGNVVAMQARQVNPLTMEIVSFDRGQ